MAVAIGRARSWSAGWAGSLRAVLGGWLDAVLAALLEGFAAPPPSKYGDVDGSMLAEIGRDLEAYDRALCSLRKRL